MAAGVESVEESTGLDVQGGALVGLDRSPGSWLGLSLHALLLDSLGFLTSWRYEGHHTAYMESGAHENECSKRPKRKL